MATQVQFRRGTTSQNNAFTGAQGEFTVDTEQWTIRIHDGTTPGGKTVPTLSATQTFTNKTLGSNSVWNGNAVGLGYGGTGAALSGVAGAVVYSTGSAMAMSLAGTSGQVLTSGGTSGPTWVNASSLSTGTATSAITAQNILGGSAGYLMYQSDTDTTGFIAPGTAGYILKSTGASTAPGWVTSDLTIGSTAVSVGTTETNFTGINTFYITGTTDASSDTTGVLRVAGGASVKKNLYVGGNLIVNGTTTTINSTTVTVDDKNIELGSVDTPTNTTANGGGITLKGDTDKTIIWDSSNSNWTSSEHWNIASGKSFKIATVPVLTSTTVLNDSTQTSIGIGGYATTISLGASTGTTTINHDLGVNGGDIVTTATTFNLLNANATTVTAFGAATALTLGATGSATLTVNPGTVVGYNTTQNLFNTTATTINAFGAATTIGIGASTGTLTVNNAQTVFNSTKSIQVPVGTTAERPTAVTGQIRYNTDLSTFEGYAASAWGSLGGVTSVDKLTYIIAETSAGASNGEIEFYAEDATGLTATKVLGLNYSRMLELTGTVVGSQTTQNLFNTTATTVNAFGASTATTIGATTGTHTIRNATVSLPNATAITTGQTTVALLNTTATTINAFGAATTLTLGATSGTATIRNSTVAITNAATVGSTLGVTGDLTVNTNKFSVTASSGNTSVAGTLAVTGDQTNTGNLAVNGGSLTTTATTANLFNANATTLNIGSAATAVNIGASSTSTVTVRNDLTVTGNLTVNGTQQYVQGTNTVYTDNIIELHAPTGGVGGTWSSDDGKDVGLRIHYYKSGADKNAALIWANDSQAIEYYSSGSETAGVFSGTYGNFKGSGFLFAGSTSGITTVQPAATASGTLTLPAATDTLVGKATTDTLTNKSIDLTNNTLTFTSLQLKTACSDETGSGALVFATSPTLVTPTLGVASATTINKVTITAPATGSTLTIADGKTLTVNNTLTFTGTDSSSVAFGGGGTVVYTSNKLSALSSTSSSELAGVISDETGSGLLVFNNSPSLTTPTIGSAGANFSGSTSGTITVVASAIAGANTLTLPAATDTLVGKATTDTLTNKTLTSPTLTTPVLGTPSSGTLTNCTGLPISSGVSGLGTSVATALAVAVGSAGAFVTNGGALGTPSSGTLTNCTFPTLNQNTTGTAGGLSGTPNITVGTISSGALTVTGAITATTSITAYYSDDRLKTKTGNIENALAKVLSLDGFHYHANETAVALGYDASIEEVGLSAQQVQAVLPEVVVPAPIDPQYMTIHYDRVIPLLVEAIKEQQKQIEELKAQLGK